MSKLIHLWIRQALVRRRQVRGGERISLCARYCSSPQINSMRGASVIEQNDRSDGAARISEEFELALDNQTSRNS